MTNYFKCLWLRDINYDKADYDKAKINYDKAKTDYDEAMTKRLRLWTKDYENKNKLK